jgi:hypothetical protein
MLLGAAAWRPTVAALDAAGSNGESASKTAAPPSAPASADTSIASHVATNGVGGSIAAAANSPNASAAKQIVPTRHGTGVNEANRERSFID